MTKRGMRQTYQRVATRTGLILVLVLGAFAGAASAHEEGSERIVILEMLYWTRSDRCRLSERLGKKKNQLAFRGKKEPGNLQCLVRFSAAEFERQFRFCALSAYDHQSNRLGNCEFGFDRESYTFRAGILTNEPGDYQHACSFVCLMKDGRKVSP